MKKYNIYLGIFLVLFIILCNTDAYTISKNRNISNSTKIKSIPKEIILGSEQIFYLMNIKCDCESFACQGGCFIMKEKILDYLKLKTGYSYQPSKIITSSDLKICYPDKGNYISFNNTNLIEIINKTGNIYNLTRLQNITGKIKEVRIYTK